VLPDFPKTFIAIFWKLLNYLVKTMYMSDDTLESLISFSTDEYTPKR